MLGYSPPSFAAYAAEENIILTVYFKRMGEQAKKNCQKPLKLHIKSSILE